MDALLRVYIITTRDQLYMLYVFKNILQEMTVFKMYFDLPMYLKRENKA